MVNNRFPFTMSWRREWKESKHVKKVKILILRGCYLQSNFDLIEISALLYKTTFKISLGQSRIFHPFPKSVSATQSLSSVRW